MDLADHAGPYQSSCFLKELTWREPVWRNPA